MLSLRLAQAFLLLMFELWLVDLSSSLSLNVIGTFKVWHSGCHFDLNRGLR